MSEETSKELEAVIRKHYHDEITGGLMTDFYIMVAGIPDDENPMTQYLFESSETPLHSIIGLARMGLKHIEDAEEE